jgi:hypothetical protein
VADDRSGSSQEAEEVTDEPKPLTEEELGRLERWVRGVVEDRRDANAMVEWGAEELLRLVVEVRHLRDLVKRVQPFTVGRYGAARNSEDEKELLGLRRSSRPR